MAGPYLVGIDCGTQSAKVVIYDATGAVVARGQQALRPMSRPRHGVALHPDDDLWTAIVAAGRAAMASPATLPRSPASASARSGAARRSSAPTGRWSNH